ncbi:MAG: methionyl-tRNA formyltransferase [Desulfobacterales bacterium]|nr:methionyl-tRNA formyltransferase [Desulfobacterales bacterium]
MKKTFKVIFMGTPPFSVPALKALNKSDYDIAMVVTQPDRPRGRGRKLTPPAVKAAAEKMGYRIIQPASIKTRDFADQIGKLKPDFLVVIAYGRILPEDVLAVPRIGTINVHASLLPKYRGPAPIQWAIINREKVSGVCTMRMEKGLDTGDILLTATEPIKPDDTAGTLHDRLAVKGAHLLIDTLKGFADNSIHPIPQDHKRATYAPMLAKDDGLINWNNCAVSLEAFIRGVTPWPGAYTFLGDNRLKIFKSCSLKMKTTEPPGTVLKGFPDELRIATADGVLSVKEIQGASGKRLSITDFLRGYKIPLNSVLG